MEAAGLTNGGFYRNVTSKDDLRPAHWNSAGNGSTKV